MLMLNVSKPILIISCCFVNSILVIFSPRLIYVFNENGYLEKNSCCPLSASEVFRLLQFLWIYSKPLKFAISHCVNSGTTRFSSNSITCLGRTIQTRYKINLYRG